MDTKRANLEQVSRPGLLLGTRLPSLTVRFVTCLQILIGRFKGAQLDTNTGLAALELRSNRRMGTPFDYTIHAHLNEIVVSLALIAHFQASDELNWFIRSSRNCMRPTIASFTPAGGKQLEWYNESTRIFIEASGGLAS